MRRYLFALTASALMAGHGAAVADDAADWRARATARVLKENKRTIVDAMFPNGSSTSFWASRRADGTRHDGFAQYLCLELAAAKPPGGRAFTVIHVWDAAAMARGQLAEIGRHECVIEP